MAEAKRRRAEPVRRRPGNGEPGGLWHQPATMNLLADLLLLLGGALLVVAMATALQRLPVFPLRQLVVTTPLSHVAREQVEQTASTILGGNFFTVDLDAAHAGFARMPWVRRAVVRRHWPDTIELQIEEHEAAAFWTPSDDGPRLLNRQGEIFPAEIDAALPRLAGADAVAATVLDRHREWSSVLSPLSRRITDLQVSSRGAWRARLDSGMEIDLGRERSGDAIATRLVRLVAQFPDLQSRLAASPAVIDLRYPNGYAVRAHGATKKS